jgi:very-short-patch-repair endonuclease
LEGVVFMPTIYKKNCDFCGKYYEGYGANYCSVECRRNSMKTSKIVKCTFCGKDTKKYLSELKISKMPYCSNECFYEDVRHNKVLNRAKREKINCKHCNKEIELVGYDLKQKGIDRKKYCSKYCMDEHRKEWVGAKNPKYEPDKHIKRICAWCNKEFEIPTAWLKRKERNNGKFCSHNCNGAYQARYSQKSVSKIEKRFGKDLSKLGYKFEKQAKIGQFVPDFYFRDKKLIIEFDGDYWHSLPRIIEKDKRKNKYYKENGYKLIRVKEYDYCNDKENLMNKLKKQIYAI